MKKKFILFILVVAAAGAGVYMWRGSSRGNDNTLRISGNIELTEVAIGFKTAGRLIERTVDEGDSVKKGQILARLDRDQLVAERARDVAALQGAETQVAQAETSIQWERANLAADIEQRQADL